MPATLHQGIDGTDRTGVFNQTLIVYRELHLLRMQIDQAAANLNVPLWYHLVRIHWRKLSPVIGKEENERIRNKLQSAETLLADRRNNNPRSQGFKEQNYSEARHIIEETDMRLLQFAQTAGLYIQIHRRDTGMDRMRRRIGLPNVKN